MKIKNICICTVVLALAFYSGCGPSEEEQRRRDQAWQARQDSLEKVRRQRLQQQRMDSLAEARADSIVQLEQQPEFSFNPDGNYAVQVGSWRSRVKAERLAQMWQEERGFSNAYVVKYGNEATGDVWFRVRLGKLSSKEEAQQLMQSLQENYQTDSWASYL